MYADTANVVNLCEFLSLFCPRFALISFLPVLLAFPLLLHCLIFSNCPCVCQPAVVCIFVMRSRSPSPSSGSSGEEHEKERDGESSRESRSRTRQQETGTERPASPASRRSVSEPMLPTQSPSTSAPAREIRRFPCPLGCSKSVRRLERHLQSGKHSLPARAAKRLVQRALKAGRTPKGGRHRKHCPVEGCRSVSSRLSQHLRSIHANLSEAEIRRLRCKARPVKPLRAATQATASNGCQPQSLPALSSTSTTIVDADMTASNRPILPLIKEYSRWRRSDAGGGQSAASASEEAMRIQRFFDWARSRDLAALVEVRICGFLESLKPALKLSTCSCYMRALLEFARYLEVSCQISDERARRLAVLLTNMCRSLRRQERQQRAETDVDADSDRLPAAIRSRYLGSQYVERIRCFLGPSGLSHRHFVACRDYLITAITLWNGHRPGVLLSLRVRDVLAATTEVVEGEGPESSRTYASMAVPKHKTSAPCGAAIVSVPVYNGLYAELVRFCNLVLDLFAATPAHPVFCNRYGARFASSNGINSCLQRSYVASGATSEFPQRFTASKNRKLITTEARNKDPAMAPLIAAQLCHSLAVADRSYALQRRRQLSARAVDFAARAIDESAQLERRKTRRAIDQYIAQDVRGRTMSRGETPAGQGTVEEEPPIASGPPSPDPPPVPDLTPCPEPVTFSGIPGDLVAFHRTLLSLLPCLDWDNIAADANRWVFDLGLDRLRSDTSVGRIASSLHEELSRRFNVDLTELIQQEGLEYRCGSRADVQEAVILLASARLGVLMGSSQTIGRHPGLRELARPSEQESPENEPTSEQEEGGSHVTMVSGSGEQTAWRPLSVKGTNTEKRSSCPLTVIGFKRKKATTYPRHEETERQPGNHKGSSAKFPVKISKVLREIFAAFLEAGRAVSRAQVREKMHLVKALFPHLTELQVLWFLQDQSSSSSSK